MQDEELRVLLNKWNAPSAPGSLDQRIAASYHQTMAGMNEQIGSVLDPQRDSEVVKMKFCSTCQEQFADRFSFCPVDGTPLSAVATTPVAPPKASAPIDVESSYPMSETVSPIAPKATVPVAPIQSAPVVQPALMGLSLVARPARIESAQPGPSLWERLD